MLTVVSLVAGAGHLGDGGDALDVGEVKGLEHIGGVEVHVDVVQVQEGAVGDEVHAALALLLLDLEGDATDGTARDALHQVRDKTSDLVPEALGGDGSNLLADLLVGVEVEGQTSGRGVGLGDMGEAPERADYSECKLRGARE